MKIKCRYESGFTLIEITIVLLVVAILLGYTVAMFPIQQELKQYREADREMNEIINQLVGFAQINGRLPCPDTSGGPTPGVIDGQSDALDAINNVTGVAGADFLLDSCESYFGFLPAVTLGINGDLNASGNLLDPWGQPYRYHISNVNTSGFPVIDLVSPNGIREEGLSVVTPNLHICTDSDALGNDNDCGDVSGDVVALNVAAVILSTGKDRNIALTTANNSAIQIENLDDFHDGTNDKVYVSSSRSDLVNAQYDDVVKWLSTNQLFTKMIEADQLP
jgi:prepilin-type N-terminal cleavage/methylation domain-containing protein